VVLLGPIQEVGVSELALSAAVRATLLAAGCWVAHVGADRRRKNQGRQPLGKGAPDILALDRGIPIALETKATHRPTCTCGSCEDQREWARLWRLAGGAYAIVRTVEDALGAVQALRNGR
jgi:hypothetical protein